jgi:hypothetical protein
MSLQVDTSHTYMAVRIFLHGVRERLWLAGVAAPPSKGLVHATIFPRIFPATTYLAARRGVEQSRFIVLQVPLHAGSSDEGLSCVALARGPGRGANSHWQRPPWSCFLKADGETATTWAWVDIEVSSHLFTILEFWADWTPACRVTTSFGGLSIWI